MKVSLTDTHAGVLYVTVLGAFHTTATYLIASDDLTTGFIFSLLCIVPWLAMLLVIRVAGKARVAFDAAPTSPGVDTY